MKRLALWLAILLALAGTGVALAQGTLPQPVGYVNDFANVLPDNVESGLENSLRQFEEETTVELAVVTVPNLGGDTVEGYAVRLFNQWGIGKQDGDNGVLMLLAVEDRQVRIEVGYGMEPYLTDGQTGRILDTQVVPELRQNNYAQGILKGAQAVANTIKASDYRPGTVRSRESPWPFGAVSPLLVLALFGVVVYVAAFLARPKSYWLGGVLGSAMGAALGWFLGGVNVLILLSIGLGVLGLLLFAALSAIKDTGITWGGGSSYDNSSASSGSDSGSSDRSSSHDSDRGGFGGGSSGGGGASRSF
jgi:uncharacterized protein